jgi:hypothetical protein
MDPEAFDYGIPFYDDDGVLIPPQRPNTPEPEPVDSNVTPEVSDLSDGCDRCRGKFVYKRRPVQKPVQKKRVVAKAKSRK